MSRQELPRSASPLKRRASSMPPDENHDASEDVDMISVPSVPPADDDMPIVDSDPFQGSAQCVQELVDDESKAPASPAVEVGDNDTDVPDLNYLEVDRASIEETQVGSEIEDDTLLTEIIPDGADTQEQDQEPGKGRDDNSVQGNIPSQNGSSSHNSDETADSDTKTVDTAATSASIEPSSKPSSLNGAILEPIVSGKVEGNRTGRNSPAPSGPATRGRQAQSGRVMGCTGLQNLGNTCYMNSALQCIRSVEELTKYFLVGNHNEEMNYDNPLGHGGNVARAYGFLLQQIYKNPAPSYVTPSTFKNTVGRYAPQFSGWGQQDTQEFLGFLLDGLQEDLNRVQKKPYIEKPDSTDDMVNNPAAIRELAAQVWDIHKKRDDSIIGDLFTGLYKSTLVCPECDKVSITFEPFNNLTLPLPMQSVWSRKVKFYPLNDVPININIEIDKTASIKALKDFISARVGVPSECIVGAEEYKDKFFKIYDDYQTASDEINKDDIPAFFEVEAPPTNNQGKKKKKFNRSVLDNDEDLPNSWNDPMAENLLVPVCHRLNPRSNKELRFQPVRNSENISPPHFIVLTPEEARNEDTIRRKILEKVATFTTWSGLACSHDTDASENTDLTNSSDLDSSGDGRITAKSVEGEEDIVDVSMRDATEDEETRQQEIERPSTLLKKFNKRRPEWMDPTEYLDGRLQNLFDISFFTENALIPSGWSTLNQGDRLLPRLDTRKPRPPSPSDEDMPSPSGSGTASEEDSAEDHSAAPPVEPVTRMVDESSGEESDASLPSVRDLGTLPMPLRQQKPMKLRGGKNGKKKMKGYKTYSKKGQKRLNKQQQQAARQSLQRQSLMDEDPEWGSQVDGGPLVRLGEGLVVDWDPDAWDLVFGQAPGSTENNVEGRPTFQELEMLKDEQLEAKIQARKMRHNKGISLDDCLDEFEKDEILSADDMWYCPRCKEHRRAAKKFDLWKTPDILIVHLKRFSSSGSRRDKIDVTVDFPVEGLNIAHRVLEKEDGKQEVYDLIAIDDHMGGLGGGHYTAFAKNFVDNEWYKFDDSTVSPVRETQRMIRSHAYLLFYRRRSDRALGGPKFEEILRRFNGNDEEEQVKEDDDADNSPDDAGASVRIR